MLPPGWYLWPENVWWRKLICRVFGCDSYSTAAPSYCSISKICLSDFRHKDKCHCKQLYDLLLKSKSLNNFEDWTVNKFDTVSILTAVFHWTSVGGDVEQENNNQAEILELLVPGSAPLSNSVNTLEHQVFVFSSDWNLLLSSSGLILTVCAVACCMQIREGQQRFDPDGGASRVGPEGPITLRPMLDTFHRQTVNCSWWISFTLSGATWASHLNLPLPVLSHSPVILFPLRKRGSFSSVSLQHNQSPVRTLMITWRLIQLPVACPGSLLNHFLPRSICGFRMMGVVFFGASSLEMCSRLPPLNRCSRRSLLTRQTVFLLFLFAPSSAYRCVQLSNLKSCWFSLAATEVEKLTLHFLLLHTDQKLKKTLLIKLWSHASCPVRHQTSEHKTKLLIGWKMERMRLRLFFHFLFQV